MLDSHYDDFRYSHKCLVDWLLLERYITLKFDKAFKKFLMLGKSFEKFLCRYENLITMILDLTRCAWWIDFCHKAI